MPAFRVRGGAPLSLPGGGDEPPAGDPPGQQARERRFPLGGFRCSGVVDLLKALERENRDLRQANEILRKASVFAGILRPEDIDQRPRHPRRLKARRRVLQPAHGRAANTARGRSTGK